MLSRRLERRGFTVVMAVDGGEGVAMARSEMPDLVLMDMSLPAMNGWEATQAVERLSVAAIRLGALAARLTEGPLLVQRDVGDAAAPLKGRLETVLVVDDDEDNRNVLAGGQPSWATASSRPATASKHWKHSLSPTPASTSCCST